MILMIVMSKIQWQTTPSQRRASFKSDLKVCIRSLASSVSSHQSLYASWGVTNDRITDLIEPILRNMYSFHGFHGALWCALFQMQPFRQYAPVWAVAFSQQQFLQFVCPPVSYYCQTLISPETKQSETSNGTFYFGCKTVNHEETCIPSESDRECFQDCWQPRSCGGFCAPEHKSGFTNFKRVPPLDNNQSCGSQVYRANGFVIICSTGQ